MPEAEAIEPVSFVNDQGNLLIGELFIPDSPKAGVVLAHPHPQHGGNMKSIVPGALFTELPKDDYAVLRFNFRGIEGSEGEFGGGLGERMDLVTAINYLNEPLEGLPIFVAGWSFGADTALTLDHEALAGWFLVAPPFRELFRPMMVASGDRRPKWFCIPQNDQFCRPQEVRDHTEGWRNTEVHEVSGADHFLVGRLDSVTDQCRTFLSETIEKSES